MKIIGFIPARYGSTRLHAKALAKINGKTMIERVYTNSAKSKELEKVVVLTDNDLIANEVKNFGGNVAMTSENCNSGTERIISILNDFDFDVALNIQGDEPLVNSEDLDNLSRVFLNEKDVNIATLIRKIEAHEAESVKNPNCVKVVLDAWQNAIYFSRANIPYNRDNIDVTYYQHIGIYAYKKEVLQKFDKFESKILENIEKLEQLRFLENGYKIKTVLTKNKYVSVDVKEDLEAVEKALN